MDTEDYNDDGTRGSKRRSADREADAHDAEPEEEEEYEEDATECKLTGLTAQQLLSIIENHPQAELPTDEDGLQQFLNSIMDSTSMRASDEELDDYPYRNADLNTVSIDVNTFDPWFHVEHLDEAHPFVCAWRHMQMISTVTDRAWVAGLQRDTRSTIDNLRSAMTQNRLHPDIPRRIHQFYLDALCNTLVKMVSDTDIALPAHMKEDDQRSAKDIVELNRAIATIELQDRKSDESLKPALALYAPPTDRSALITHAQAEASMARDQARIRQTLMAHVQDQVEPRGIVDDSMI